MAKSTEISIVKKSSLYELSDKHQNFDREKSAKSRVSGGRVITKHPQINKLFSNPAGLS